MDPQATLNRVLTTMLDSSTRAEHLQALIEWIERGGFKPETWAHQIAQLRAMSRFAPFTGLVPRLLALLGYSC